VQVSQTFGRAAEAITGMTSDAVLEFLDLMEASSIAVCLDGGWGIDALLGEQTREHGDLDIIVRVEEVPRLVAVTRASGYARQPGGTDTGFVLKTAPPDELVAAIRRVAAGERVLDPGLALTALSEGDNPLTPRERDVLSAAVDGATIADIAARLRLSKGTVRNHLSVAIQKVGGRNRVEAARLAEEKGWL